MLDILLLKRKPVSMHLLIPVTRLNRDQHPICPVIFSGEPVGTMFALLLAPMFYTFIACKESSKAAEAPHVAEAPHSV